MHVEDDPLIKSFTSYPSNLVIMLLLETMILVLRMGIIVKRSNPPSFKDPDVIIKPSNEFKRTEEHYELLEFCLQANVETSKAKRKERALLSAKMYHPGYPCFFIILKPSHVGKKCELILSGQKIRYLCSASECSVVLRKGYDLILLGKISWKEMSMYLS